MGINKLAVPPSFSWHISLSVVPLLLSRYLKLVVLSLICPQFIVQFPIFRGLWQHLVSGRWHLVVKAEACLLLFLLLELIEWSVLQIQLRGGPSEGWVYTLVLFHLLENLLAELSEGNLVSAVVWVYQRLQLRIDGDIILLESLLEIAYGYLALLKLLDRRTQVLFFWGCELPFGACFGRFLIQGVGLANTPKIFDRRRIELSLTSVQLKSPLDVVEFGLSSHRVSPQKGIEFRGWSDAHLL